ncbi:MAG: hypothetical protein K5778_00910 [Bacteroidaceae bacterium]|nr:hypothetical protein [Bacteroidaceae bacterium]
MKKTMILALASMLTLAACNDNDDILGEVQPNNPSSDKTEELGPTVPLNVTAISTADAGAEVKGQNDGLRFIQPSVTTTGVTLAWETSDKIEVLLGADMAKTQLPLTEKQTEQKALFAGDIATGGATVTASTPLYSYVASEDITFNATAKTLTIDLTQQDGSIEDAVRHSLFLAQAPYDDGSVTFDYTNQLAIMELKFRAVGNENGSATVTFSADQGIPGSVTFNPATGVTTTVSGTSVSATNVQFTNGEATCYVAIAPNSYGSANAQSILNAKVRIDINGNTCYYVHNFSATNIPAGAIVADKLFEQRIKDPKVPIGTILYDDGTWGDKDVPSTKNAVGVIYDNEPSAEDRAAGFTHGYAVGLHDAPPVVVLGMSEYKNALKWTTTNVNRQNRPKFEIVDGSTVAQVNQVLATEPSGLGWTTALHDVKTNLGNPEFKVFDWAWQQAQRSDSDGRNYQGFIPTVGHMYRLFKNLGGLDDTGTAVSKHNSSSSMYDQIAWAGQSTSVMNTLVTNLNIPQGSVGNAAEASINPMFVANIDYWTATEYDGNEAFIFKFDNSNNRIWCEAEVKSDLKQARYFVAF